MASRSGAFVVADRASKSAPRERGSSEFFCSNPGCPFHVPVDDSRLDDTGGWATLADGLTASHRWINGELLCDLCSARRNR